MKTAPCRTCGATWHTRSYHNQKARKPLETTTPLRAKLHCTRCDSLTHVYSQCPERLTDKINPKTGRYPTVKRLRTKGKYTIRWEATRRAWIKLNPPDHAGYYYCHYCSVAMTVNEMTLDHMQSRTRAPELRYEMTNLLPSCGPHNVEKGSLSHDEFCTICDIT